MHYTGEVLLIAVNTALGFSFHAINLAGYLMGKVQSFAISIQFSCTLFVGSVSNSKVQWLNIATNCPKINGQF